MDLGIKGKNALVCASSKGMGKAVAVELAREGAAVFMCARDKGVLEKAAEDVKSAGAASVHLMECDLTDPDSASLLVSNVQSRFGHIDILVHNVGGPKPTTAMETTLSEWENGYRLLFESVVRLNQAFLPGMKERRWGRIACITSLSVMEPIPSLAISNAMRSAVTAMLKTLADEVAKYNICINCIAPGVILTDRTEERIQAKIKTAGGTREEYLNEYVRSIPAGRVGTSEEFAAAVAFLCSDKASYITGSTLCVDGGKRRSTT